MNDKSLIEGGGHGGYQNTSHMEPRLYRKEYSTHTIAVYQGWVLCNEVKVEVFYAFISKGLCIISRYFDFGLGMDQVIKESEAAGERILLGEDLSGEGWVQGWIPDLLPRMVW